MTEQEPVPGRPRPTHEPIPPSLLWALSRLLPGKEETWLLRTLLGRGPEARESWHAFRSRIGDLPSLFRTDTGGRKRLSPLLLRAIRENDLPADPRLLTVLRTATLREELRVDAYEKIAGEVFAALRGKGVRFLVLKGAALSGTVYPEPALRHAHDIDLLLRPAEMTEAVTALLDLGLRRHASTEGDRGVVLRHASDLPILLLTRLYRHRFYQSRFETLWARSVAVSGRPSGEIRTMSQGDNLLHALGHASYCPSRSTLAWVTDAWMIIQGSEGVDWAAFRSEVVASRLELPACVMLRYLAYELGASVPREVLDDISDLAARAGELRRDIALHGARQSRGRHAQLSGLSDPGWRDRANLALWQLFPSREYIEWAYHRPPAALIPVIYLSRPVTYAAELLKWRLLRLIRSWRGN